MKIIQRIAENQSSYGKNRAVTIAFLGDSVTQGCFDVYKNRDGELIPVFDIRHSYVQYTSQIFNMLYPNVTFNIINAGLSGDRASSAVTRLERDVLSYKPDLVVVCYGLNDCKGTIDSYVNSLRKIFTALKESEIEIIFMTPNMMNTRISPHLSDPDVIKISEECARIQNDGLFDKFMDGARALCDEMSVPVCDCYAIWKKLYENGVNVTELLSNRINHPTKEMNAMFAYELVKAMLEI